MQKRVVHLQEKKLAGIRIKMSFTQNKTADLWAGFMSRKKEILNVVGTDLYSVQLYNSSYFHIFDPCAEFEKWAAVEVSSFENLPDWIEPLVIPSGQYAVFLFKGASSESAAFFQEILGNLIPKSVYQLDNRPHFEILGERYKNNHPDSEEEIWIPVRLK